VSPIEVVVVPGSQANDAVVFERNRSICPAWLVEPLSGWERIGTEQEHRFDEPAAAVAVETGRRAEELAFVLLFIRPMRNSNTHHTDQPALQRDPDEWKTGDEPMTDAQRSYLETLCRETGEEFDETLSKADASKRIDELRERSPRLASE
jgi:DUF3072 family protein